ncbi:hypothetical protein GCM10009790_32530 [Georgenia ruanii]
MIVSSEGSGTVGTLRIPVPLYGARAPCVPLQDDDDGTLIGQGHNDRVRQRQTLSAATQVDGNGVYVGSAGLGGGCPRRAPDSELQDQEHLPRRRRHRRLDVELFELALTCGFAVSRARGGTLGNRGACALPRRDGGGETLTVTS